ncbi:MAG: (d)CMP kinase [Dysosmobacter welbionis]
MSENIRVAIDGPSGAGKSTLARSVAARLNFLYVDTGAIYRTIGYAVWRKGIDPRDRSAVVAVLPDLEICLTYGTDGLRTWAEWNGCDGGDPPAGGVPLRLSGIRLSGGSGVPAGDAAPAGRTAW